ncbi:MAG: 50S ribosomal protein L6 [Thaumarchaeota archaeon]|nr:50S ribosomal protein L6 [Nitrososphaerota archaeon]
MDTHTEVEYFEETIDIMDGITIKQNKHHLRIVGPLGKISKNFKKIPIEFKLEQNKLYIKTINNKKTDYAILHTIKSIVNNLMKGLITGYTIKMKTVYSHFPISIKIKENEIHIENFIGERHPRIIKIHGNTKAKVVSGDIILTGNVLTDVTQTAADLQLRTKIKNKDPRVFLDGIFIQSQSNHID